MTPVVSTLRILWLFESAMSRLPSGATTSPRGDANSAATAGPPSPAKPICPLPANVSMTPSRPTTRIRWLCMSATNSRPSLATATPAGESSSAETAKPPSPPNPCTPFPTMVLRSPPLILRTRWFPPSQTSKAPVASTASPNGPRKLAAAAASPSPANPTIPVPAKVRIRPLATARTR